MKTLSTLLLLAALQTNAFAGGGVVGNGGDLSEIEVINTGYVLSGFIATPEGRQIFPEIDPARFKKVVDETLIKVSDDPVYDKTKTRRSAINYRISSETDSATVIRFDRTAFETWKKNKAEQVVLVFHEYLNLMGIELSSATFGDKELPSSVYTESKRILPHVAKLFGDHLQTLKTGRFLRLSCTNIRRPIGTGLWLYPNGKIDLQGRFYLPKPIRRKHYRASTQFKGEYEAIQFKNGNELNVFFKKVRRGKTTMYYSLKVLYSGDDEVALGYLEAADFDFRTLDAKKRHRQLYRSMPFRCVLVELDSHILDSEEEKEEQYEEEQEQEEQEKPRFWRRKNSSK